MKKRIFLSRKVKRALAEYKELCEYGCLKISCKQCKHFYKISDGLYGCKREQLMKVLHPKYIEEMREIDNVTRG